MWNISGDVSNTDGFLDCGLGVISHQFWQLQGANSYAIIIIFLLHVDADAGYPNRTISTRVLGSPCFSSFVGAAGVLDQLTTISSPVSCPLVTVPLAGSASNLA